MKIKLSQLRKVIREELLREGQQASPDALAAFTIDSQESIAAIFYDPTVFISELKNTDKFMDSAKVAARGYLSLKFTSGDPETPCADADKVVATWGPGYGDVVYHTAFALSRNGVIMSDRGAVSPKARNWWLKKTGDYKTIPLDDYEHKICTDPRHPIHTEDPRDDCYVHTLPNPFNPSTIAINNAYDGSAFVPQYKAALATMQKRHDSLVNDVDNLTPRPARLANAKINDIAEVDTVIKNVLRTAAVNKFMDSLGLEHVS